MATPVILHKGALEPGINNPIVPRTVTNLILQSEDVSTSWLNARSTDSTNVVAGPDGVHTADELIEDATASNNHKLYQLVNFFTSGTQYEFTGSFQANTRDEVRLFFDSIAFPANSYAHFNIAAGSISSTGAGADNSFIRSEGNGWYRCTLIATCDSTQVSMRTDITLGVGGTDVYNGDGSSSIYLTHLQVAEQPSPSAYVKTTTVAATRAFNATSTKLWKGAVSPAQVLDTAPVTTGNNVLQLWKGSVEPNDLGERDGNEYVASKGAVQPTRDYDAPLVPRKGGRSKKGKRYVVEIDGELIQVENIAAVQSVLAQARAMAEESAKQDVTTPTQVKPPRVTVKTGSGNATTSVTIKRAVRDTQAAINRIYRDTAKAIQVEQEKIRAFEAKLIEEDEEDSILALLL